MQAGADDVQACGDSLVNFLEEEESPQHKVEEHISYYSADARE